MRYKAKHRNEVRITKRTSKQCEDCEPVSEAKRSVTEPVCEGEAAAVLPEEFIIFNLIFPVRREG